MLFIFVIFVDIMVRVVQNGTNIYLTVPKILTWKNDAESLLAFILFRAKLQVYPRKYHDVY